MLFSFCLLNESLKIIILSNLNIFVLTPTIRILILHRIISLNLTIVEKLSEINLGNYSVNKIQHK